MTPRRGARGGRASSGSSGKGTSSGSSGKGASSGGSAGGDGSGWGFPEHQPRLPGSGPWRAAGKRPFGATWWGRAWVDAIEQRAQLDPNRLPRGRTYARTGAVEGLRVAAGEITAAVQGSRRTPYQVRVRVRAWTDVEWEQVLEALAAQIGHTAALLDGELPPEVADDVRTTGLDLLPGPGEVQPRCSCPDWADPCKHAAAACYLVADALDADPFVLLALRGRGRDELLAALRARRGLAPAAGIDAGDRSADPRPEAGLVARDAWAAWSERTAAGPLLAPVPPVPPRRPGAPTVLGVDAPPGSGVSAAALRQLATDAAARALALALGAKSTGLELDADQDLARWASRPDPAGGDRHDAAGEPGPTAPASREVLPDASSAGGAGSVSSSLGLLASRSGVPARQLLRRALAWGQGGADALAVLDEQWDPGAEVLAGGRALLGPGASGRRNRVTLGDRQLRLGRDGRWYPYRKVGAGWDPDGAPVDPTPGEPSAKRHPR
ncbi:MAG: SWIM zinc finger family protein [Actinomycetota bacterium]|nr:SWIM zinc finger family protein [Actinomycetota bacterium]